MSPVVASAPGKVVVCGEYAVLDGAPAISMAVNRRAVVTIAAADGDVCSVSAPGYAAARRRFRIGQDAPDWVDEGAALPVIEAAFRCGVLAGTAAVDIVLDTRAFSEQDSKLGIGSSAALTAALAVAATQGKNPAVAFDIHGELQGGRGSGVDVATALHGGTIEYRIPDRRTSPAPWPAGLSCALLWSRVPADTVSRIARLEDAPVRDSRTELTAVAESCAKAWRSGGPEDVLTELGRFTQVLQQFDVDHALGIFEAGHAELTAAAPEGLVYKPCGAGGGDIGIAVARDAAILAGFVADAERRGFSRLDAAMDPAGAMIEETHDA